ncbi:MAG: hypothetical protein KIT84_26485 [Labilithrix sp.]|nr:hypothetical protein [Labilithrix sp.]
MRDPTAIDPRAPALNYVAEKPRGGEHAAPLTIDIPATREHTRIIVIVDFCGSGDGGGSELRLAA